MIDYFYLCFNLHKIPYFLTKIRKCQLTLFDEDYRIT